ncbi:MAG: S-adenosylmethionine:tRNA ribosyltransferase-isomerase, partial [Bdellovibrionia bacterium]
NGTIQEGSQLATLVITPAYRRKIVTGVISGFHENGASHLQLLGSFLTITQLEAAYRDAETRGYLCHEFGDSCLILN